MSAYLCDIYELCVYFGGVGDIFIRIEECDKCVTGFVDITMSVVVMVVVLVRWV